VTVRRQARPGARPASPGTRCARWTPSTCVSSAPTCSPCTSSSTLTRRARPGPAA